MAVADVTVARDVLHQPELQVDARHHVVVRHDGEDGPALQPILHLGGGEGGGAEV